MPHRPEHYGFLMVTALLFAMLLAGAPGVTLFLAFIGWMALGIACASVPDDDRRD